MCYVNQVLGYLKSISSFKKILFIFREMGREGEREGEKHQCVVAPNMPPTGSLARNPGLCPDWNQTTNPLLAVWHSSH